MCHDAEKVQPQVHLGERALAHLILLCGHWSPLWSGGHSSGFDYPEMFCPFFVSQLLDYLIP